MTETMSLSLIDSHCHIDMPENAEQPRKRPDCAGDSVWFDAGLTVRRVWAARYQRERELRPSGAEGCATRDGRCGAGPRSRPGGPA